MSFTAVGTSSSLGLCNDDPELIVRDLSLVANMTLTGVGSLLPRNYVQNWFAPVTTYPLTTPFLISSNDEIGAGTMNTRIFLQCPTAGSPVAQFDLAFYDN